MKLPIMYTSFEERQKINDLFGADYYGFSVDRKTNSLVVTAYENDKKTVKGVTLCMVDGEPAYFIGAESLQYSPDDRQYFAVIMIEEDSDGYAKRVNDIDNFITLLAPVMDAQALYQPADDDDDIIPAE